ncbi:MAG: hypothetical protein IV085_08015 [Thiobacillus sp.]|nr:hypothetical protein [Thiobacillus sp.]
MNTHDTVLEVQADLLVEEAMKELGATPLDEPDEYSEQCDYAGCYPWLMDVVCAHVHEHPVPPMLHDEAVDGEADFYV